MFFSTDQSFAALTKPYPKRDDPGKARNNPPDKPPGAQSGEARDTALAPVHLHDYPRSSARVHFSQDVPNYTPNKPNNQYTLQDYTSNKQDHTLTQQNYQHIPSLRRLGAFLVSVLQSWGNDTVTRQPPDVYSPPVVDYSKDTLGKIIKWYELMFLCPHQGSLWSYVLTRGAYGPMSSPGELMVPCPHQQSVRFDALTWRAYVPMP